MISHGVLPSQIRTRLSGAAAASSITSGGGANGHREERSIGYSGAASAASGSEVKVSDIAHSSTWMAWAGQAAAARRTLSA